MKQTIKTSLEYKRAIYVKNLYKQLKKDRIGTTVIETMSSKQCSTLLIVELTIYFSEKQETRNELARTSQVEIYVQNRAHLLFVEGSGITES